MKVVATWSVCVATVTGVFVKRGTSGLQERFVSSTGEDSSSLNASSECVTFTGGACVLSDCEAWRGATTCDYGKCHCVDGCASASGKCYSAGFAVASTSVQFLNVRYQNHSLASSQVLLSVRDDERGCKFNLLKLPGNDENNTFEIVAEEDPKYALRLACESEFVQLNSSTSARSDRCNLVGKMAHLEPVTGHLPASNVAVRLWAVPNRTGTVMIESFEHAGLYLYVPHGSWGLAGYSGDPGESGYWTPQPALPMQLPVYTGPRCTVDCVQDASDSNWFMERLQELKKLWPR